MLVKPNCVVALTNTDGVEIIAPDTVPNANMQWESGPTANPTYADDMKDWRPLYGIRIDNPESLTWPTPGDIVNVLQFDDEPRLVGEWEIDHIETGGFSTQLLFVKSYIEVTL